MTSYHQNEFFNDKLINDDFEMKITAEEIQLHIRLGFIRKVYGILSAQLLLTFLMCSFSVLSTSFAEFQISYPSLLWISMIGSIVTVCLLSCFQSNLRTVPNNYIILGLFTFFESYLVSCICAMTEPGVVLMAAFMTCGITFALTYFAYTTKTDFTVFNSVLFLAIICLCFFGLFTLFTNNRIIDVMYCCFGVLVYSIYIVMDTQMICDKGTYSLDTDDYILAALNLYLDIINLFIYILRLLKK